MSFALTFVAAGLAVMWLPAAVLFGFCLYLGAWCAGLLLLGGVLALGRWAWGCVDRAAARWHYVARLGAALAFGVGVGLALLLTLVLYSVASGVPHA
jgi:hypothetical protein